MATIQIADKPTLDLVKNKTDLIGSANPAIGGTGTVFEYLKKLEGSDNPVSFGFETTGGFLDKCIVYNDKIILYDLNPTDVTTLNTQNAGQSFSNAIMSNSNACIAQYFPATYTAKKTKIKKVGFYPTASTGNYGIKIQIYNQTTGKVLVEKPYDLSKFALNQFNYVDFTNDIYSYEPTDEIMVRIITNGYSGNYMSIQVIPNDGSTDYGGVYYAPTESGSWGMYYDETGSIALHVEFAEQRPLSGNYYVPIDKYILVGLKNLYYNINKPANTNITCDVIGFDTSSDVDVVYNGTPITSAGVNPLNMFDGNDATYWSSTGVVSGGYDKYHVGYLFNDPKYISGFKLKQYNGANFSVDNVMVQVSRDGANWEDVESINVLESLAGNTFFKLNHPVLAKGIRIYPNKSGDAANSWQVYTLQFTEYAPVVRVSNVPSNYNLSTITDNAVLFKFNLSKNAITTQSPEFLNALWSYVGVDNAVTASNIRSIPMSYQGSVRSTSMVDLISVKGSGTIVGLHGYANHSTVMVRYSLIVDDINIINISTLTAPGVATGSCNFMYKFENGFTLQGISGTTSYDATYLLTYTLDDK